MLRLWEGVRDNQRRLDGCDGHDFEAVDVDEAKTKLSSVGQQARCRHCGGEMSLPMADQYRAGEARGIRTVLEDLDALQRVVDAVPEATLVNSGGKSTLDFIREAAQRRLDELAVMERSSVTAVAEPDAAIDPVKD